MSPTANTPGILVWNFSVSTFSAFFSSASPHSAIEKKALKVDTEKYQTSIPGVFAVGDINTYPGKKKLILSGFHEAALAAFAIQHHLYPQKKQFLQYTTTSPVMHQRLGVPD